MGRQISPRTFVNQSLKSRQPAKIDLLLKNHRKKLRPFCELAVRCQIPHIQPGTAASVPHSRYSAGRLAQLSFIEQHTARV
jgi:hypothetical protein